MAVGAFESRLEVGEWDFAGDRKEPDPEPTPVSRETVNMGGETGIEASKQGRARLRRRRVRTRQGACSIYGQVTFG